ncbi:ABC transporter permease subunit [Glycomyces tarimensis]
MRAVLISEYLKYRTLPLWRWFALGTAACALVASAWTAVQMRAFLQSFDDYLAASILRPREELSEATVAQMRLNYDSFSDPDTMFALFLTSGQYVGLLLAALLAATIVTSEVRHRTLGASFLAVPRREKVIAAKFLISVASGVLLWGIATAVNLAVTVVFAMTTSADFRLPLGAVAVNLGAYVTWSILGSSVATFFQNHTVAAVVLAVGYVASSTGVQLFFELVDQFVYHSEWLYRLQVLVPGVASQLMTAVEREMPQLPDPWVGAVVLLGYAVLAGTVGSVVLRRKEV